MGAAMTRLGSQVFLITHTHFSIWISRSKAALGLSVCMQLACFWSDNKGTVPTTSNFIGCFVNNTL